MPFALPPLRAELGAGTSSESFAVSQTADQDGSAETVVARAGVHPLQLVPELAGRVFDMGVGYGVEGIPNSSVYRYGPYAEVAAYPLRGSAGSGRRWRAGVLTMGDVSLDPGGPLGDGSVLLAGTAELTGFSNGSFSTEDTVGVAYGEWGVGLFAGPSVRVARGPTTWTGSAGITARIPMTFGVMCCLDPTALADSVERHTKRHHEKKHRGERRLRRVHDEKKHHPERRLLPRPANEREEQRPGRRRR